MTASNNHFMGNRTFITEDLLTQTFNREKNKSNSLTVDEARKIGINACIDTLGRDFVSKYKDYSVYAYGETKNGVFCFVGVDNSCKSQEGLLILDSQSKYPYRVSCAVDLKTGNYTFIEIVK